MKTMRIVVDGGTWGNHRGYGRFTREVLAAAAESSRHQFTLVADQSVRSPDVPATIQLINVPLGASPSQAAAASGRRSLADMWRMSRALSSAPGDCVFFPSVYTYVPLFTRTPVVVCFHDVIPERFPEHVFSSRQARLFWTLKTRVAIRQAARIVTVSEHARDGLTEVFGIPRDRVRVVPEAPARVFSPDVDLAPAAAALRGAGLSDNARFVIYVGGAGPHKNLAALIRVFVALQRRDDCGDLHLLLVGHFADDVFLSEHAALQAQARQDGGLAIHFLDGVDDVAVAGLMRLSRALVLPSLDEGFGLPGIEAAACGTAVVATRESALPETLHDAAVYFDPKDESAMSNALVQVLTSTSVRDSLAARAVERARQFTWAAAADRLLAVFDEVAG